MYVFPLFMSPSGKRAGRSGGSSQSHEGSGSGSRTVRKTPARTRKKTSEPQVTYVEDLGAVYEAPVEVVWDFMEKDDVFHPKAHAADVRNFESKGLSDITILLSYEERKGDKWEKRLCRLTEVRPAVRVQEDLVGPFAGSKTVFIYTPDGRRTVVDVFGYMQSSELTPAEIRRQRKKTWSKAYSEDLPYFRLFSEQYAAGGGKRE